VSKEPRISSQNLAVATARLVAGSCALMILLGTVLLLLPGVTRPGQSLGFLDALFTSTSAVCVTGLVVRDTALTFTPAGQWILLALIQLGGLGYMTFASVVVLAMGRALGLRERMQLLHSYEQPSLQAVPSIARNIVLVTLLAETVGALLLTGYFVSRRLFSPDEALSRAVFQSVSAYCNAGFDLMGEIHGPFASLTAYVGDVPVNLVTIGLLVTGGLGFPALANLWLAPRTRHLSVHTKLVLGTSFALLVIGTALILALEWNSARTLAPLPPGTRVLAAFFQSASARTAGFNTLAIDQLRSATAFVIGFLMFVGAAPGGTGGGVKVTTAAILAAAVWASIVGRHEPSLFYRRISVEIVLRALALLLISAAFVVIVTLLLTVTEPPALKQAGITDNVFMRIQFEALSAFGTVGLTMGITPHLSAVGKALILLSMFVGRVGPLTLAVGLAARPVPPLQYPEERVWVG
jgi:trk system potassium uptake protein TrkH